LRALHEDFLLTRRGLALCIERLSDRGVLSIARGMQQPPRDNLKLLATLRAALASLGVDDPARQIVQVRNYLAVSSMAFASPLDDGQCRLLGEAASELSLDVEWSSCAGLMGDGQRNEVDGPEGESYSWFRHAASEILSQGREGFFDRWIYNVRPATDDRPYFYDFFRWRSLPRFMRAYGKRWLTRLELGYVVVVFALAEVIVVGIVLILLPLVRLRRSRGVQAGRLATCGYFTLLGLGFMMLEMICVLRFTQFLGNPIYAAACVLSSFLVFSGLGSAASRRLCPDPRRAAGWAAVGVAVLAVCYSVGLTWVFRWLIGWPMAWRVLAAVGLTAPTAFLMGWPFPNGLTLVERHAPPLVPWAWATNGVASVAASPLAVMIAVETGFRVVLVLAGVLYLFAAVCVMRLPGRGSGQTA
jgi:hypothetical protein